MYAKICHLFICFLFGISLCVPTLLSQTCQQPFFNSFTNHTTTSINIRWADTNNAPFGWELELVERGNARTMIPTTPVLSTKQYTIENLNPATSYEVYVRTVCNENNKSAWTGPALFTTVFTNPTPCQTNLPLKDNGTEIFSIDVTDTGILGQNIFIESLDIILEHGWPADLKISLESPSGDLVTLSNHNGTITDNFGNVSSENCDEVTSFHANACLSLKDSKPPYIGTFLPDGDINSLGTGTQAQGKWKIVFFDRALKDAGNLKYLNIKFNKERCVLPENFTVVNIGNNSATVDWDSYSACTTAKLSLYQDGNKINEIFIDCKEPNVALKTLKDLIPNTDYELTIEAICNNANSIESCKLFFTTTCETATLRESFDNYNRCTEGCAIDCDFTAPVWFNAKEESSQDWIIWEGNTDTENTGPTSDISGLGKYIYIENNPIICGSGNRVALLSRCIDIKSNASGCDMSFYYHMYGIDIQSLRLEISIDNRLTWEPLVTLTGDKGDEWKRVTLSLSDYDGMTAVFRFVGISGNGPIGDIAIDQIEFYKSILATGLNRYYVDRDGDNFGIENEFIDLCSSTVPNGYAQRFGDCDDRNPEINPEAIEIQCNGIDENCNGDVDDAPEVNPILYVANIQNASCNGSSDGVISLNISGGNAPYNVIWLGQSQSGTVISNLKEGFYYAEITDFGGCTTRTDFLHVGSESTINVIVTEISNTSCLGQNNGSIKIEHSTNNPPYTYLWSNGDTTKNVENLVAGEYSFTVTDSNLCSASISNLKINNNPAILTGIETIKHPSCNGSKNGFITAIAQNGAGNYKYQWSNGDTIRTVTNLGAGQYMLTVSDQNGCESILSTTLIEPDSIIATPVSIESVRCFGESNGSIKTNSVGGTPPYTYLWTGIRTTDDIFNLSAGVYTLTVTDALGCRSTPINVEVHQPALFQIIVDSIHPSDCRLGENGFVSLSTSGGTETYSYAWNHTDISANSFSNLVSGNYSVTAYDLFGCKSPIPLIFVPFNNIPILSELIVLGENKCSEDRQGSIVSTVINGNAPYDFNWSHGVQYIKNTIVDTVSQLPSGTYTLTITDAEGCVGISSPITLNQIEPITYQITNIIENICNTDSNAIININVNGGTGQHLVTWNNGIGETLSQLPNGSYFGTITDENNCQKIIETIQISSNSDIYVEGQIEHDQNNTSIGEICLDIYGGIEPIQIMWLDREEKTICISHLSSGIYAVQITDALGCVVNETFEIQNTTSTLDQESRAIDIFPNPTIGFISINSKIGINHIEVITSDGRIFLLNASNISGDEFSFDVSMFPSGLLFIKVIQAGNIEVYKVVKL